MPRHTDYLPFLWLRATAIYTQMYKAMKPGMRQLIGADEEGKIAAAAKNRRETELMQEGLHQLGCRR